MNKHFYNYQPPIPAKKLPTAFWKLEKDAVGRTDERMSAAQRNSFGWRLEEREN